MNCTCKLGGRICGVCRGREAQARAFADLVKRVSILEKCVIELQEAVEKRSTDR